MAINDIAVLTCGDYSTHSNCSDVYSNLENKISILEGRLAELPNQDDETITLLGPFYARTLMESVCVSLVGRIDPFRLLFVKQVQQQNSFGLSSRSKSAIAWFGDIFEKGLKNEELQPERMWSSSKEFVSIGRGLLGDYYGEIFWRPAFESLIDTDTQYAGESYLDDQFKRIPPENLISQVRSKMSQVYSSLSKGVHSELIIRPEIIYSRSTVLPLVSEVMDLCAFLSLLSHKIESTICRLNFDEAVTRYIAIKERSNGYGG